MAENREIALVLKLIADQFQSEMKKSGGVLGEFTSFIADWKVQVTAAGAALLAITKSAANYGEELLKTSQKTGIAVEALAGLQHAATLADLSNEQLATGLKFLARNMVEAGQQTGDGGAIFRDLGVAALDASGKLRSTESVLLDLADVFARAKDNAGKADVAVKLFGKAGVDLIPFLNQGKAGIRELMAEAQRLGLVMSKEDAEAANRFNDELKKLQAALRGIMLTIGKELIPVLTQLVETFRTLGVGTGLTSALSGLHTQLTALNVLFKELQANSQFLFGTGKDKMSFGELRARIDAIEAEAKQKLFEFQHPGVLTSGTRAPGVGAAPGDGGGRSLAAAADQEKLGKALLEIYLASNRATEIGLDLEARKGKAQEAIGKRLLEMYLEQNKAAEIGTEIELRDGKAQEARGKALLDIYLANNRAEQIARDIEAREGKAQEELGKHLLEIYLDQNKATQIGIEIEAREGKAQEEQGKRLLAIFLDQNKATQIGIEIEAREGKAQEEQGKRLLAIFLDQNKAAEIGVELDARAGAEQERRGKALLELFQIQLRANEIAARQGREDDFFAGWAEGMKNYVRDTKSGFGMAADMARRTAQMMESSFTTFFFDVMDGKIKSFKDVLNSLLEFVKQIVSQIASQLIVRNLLIAATDIGGAFALAGHGPVGSAKPAALGGEVIRRFALGGPVPGFGTRDTVPALLTPGEVVLSRQDVGDIKAGLGGSGVTVVVNNYAQAEVQATTGRGADGKQVLYLTVRDLVRGMVRRGELHGPLGAVYGLSPKPVGR